MDGIIHSLQPYLEHYGYLAVFAALFLEDFGVPMPGETLLIAGALFATKGHFNIFLLAATAWVAAVLGDNVGFAIGRFGGRRLVLRYGRYVLLTPERLKYAEGFFRRRGAVLVIFARFFEIIRQLNGIVSGIAGMEWWRFLTFNAAGAALWVGFWTTLFYQLGKQGRRAGFLFKKDEPLMILALVVVVAGVVGVRLLLKRRRGASRTETPHGPIDASEP